MLGADRRLAGTLGDRVQLERVASRLPQTLLGRARPAAGHRRRGARASPLLGVVLTATALALAGRLTAGVRAGETALLSALGTSRGQLAAAAVAGGRRRSPCVAAALAVPASSVLHAGADPPAAAGRRRAGRPARP